MTDNTIRHFVVVLPDGRRFPTKLEIYNTRFTMADYQVLQLVNKVVYDAKLTTSRKLPKSIEVEVFEQTIKNGELVEHLFKTYEINLPWEPMTTTDFEEEMAVVLDNIPNEFHRLIRSEVADHGVSYEEMLDVARGLANLMKPAIEEYTKRILKK